MRIAFVGKGGAGKSTLAGIVSLYISQKSDKPIAVFDADLNIHIPDLLGFGEIEHEHHLSHPTVSAEMKKWLIHENPIDNMGSFRKTTPPTKKSNIIKIRDIKNTPLFKYGKNRENLSVFVVGTYQNEDVGASCYHNNLAVFESILSHTDDNGGYIVADMVAGVDAFAGTLHTQFDMIVFVAEPTRKSIEVCQQYLALSEGAGTDKQVYIVGNKIQKNKDIEFINANISTDKVLGYFLYDEHIRFVDQEAKNVQMSSLKKENTDLLENIYIKLNSLPDGRQERLENLWSLHKKYVSQPFVKERFGDLEDQIDKNFSFDDA